MIPGYVQLDLLLDETRDISTAVWCPHCLLPSGIAVPILIASYGRDPLHLCVQYCPDCDQFIPVSDHEGPDDD